MNNGEMLIKPIAHIHCGYKEKFGIPRQSGLVDTVEAKIIFAPEYRNPDAFRGLEGYSHLWLLWQFSKAVRSEWSPTVRPPRLGGNMRMGVFATRSPYRPNPIGLSSVKLVSIELDTPKGPVLTVSGADLLDGTPIYDIKPYLAYTDSHPEALSGFALTSEAPKVEVVFSDTINEKIDEVLQNEITAILAEDPRPGYQDDPERIYTFKYADYEVSFKAGEGTITVTDII
ncbi:MAG: tRNA (N6-threonylcarbamoyladenosine(37)-N6)-methyltransferase TrmO [Clostridia bacterium]|nr:tRNA (N6-threonylcarbamoyladenosine(37)-N6)-methyltransferase TrmO [Clostridia bacterium]